jgi:hypothetical protein
VVGVKRLISLIVLLLFAATFLTCSDSKDTPYIPPKHWEGFHNLKLKDHTLLNLEETYKQRNIDQYDKLLDDFFIFHFAEADWQAKPPKTPVQWGREAEVGATRNMFDPNFSKPGQDPISSINLTMRYTEGDDGWTAMDTGDPVNYPGETWYWKSVWYTLTITSGDDTFFTNGEVSAVFYIRLAEVEGETIWRIVSWYDDKTAPAAYDVYSSEPEHARGVEETSWGGIKALYGGRR